MHDEREADPSAWYSTNLVGVPAPLLASTAFNAHPQPLHVSGARETATGLFALLAHSTGADDARAVFEHYMSLAFDLARPSDADQSPRRPRRPRPSYLKLLQGWGLDSNGGPGAVLKGWVESRFGLVPTFHKAPLGRYPSPAWMGYLEDKGASRYHNNNIYQQLDLMFEFCQWMLERHALLGAGPCVTLWRGSNRCEEQIVEGSLQQRRCTLRLNNLVSFATTREQADGFGDWILQAQVPLCKLLLVPGLLNTLSLRGEAEVLAIGGLYEVKAAYD